MSNGKIEQHQIHALSRYNVVTRERLTKLLVKLICLDCLNLVVAASRTIIPLVFSFSTVKEIREHDLVGHQLCLLIDWQCSHACIGNEIS